MSTRIVLIGSECTGKTTLAAKLAEHYKVKFVPEYLREYFEIKQGSLSISDAIPIASAQLELENEAEKRGDNPIICDTDIISSIVYTKYYFGSRPDWFESQLLKRSKSIYLLCDIDVKWSADGQRDMPENRNYMQKMFIKELQFRKYSFHSITGSLSERIKKSTILIDLALSNNDKAN
ncbi:AAA family ATPase [Maridesulfovibrio zosterae]|uniref:AAA family ATPase n=1 Tax=Maridesulfovibrio zosterae TaxID=82171 RepID=UPI000413360E|nr:ATP-binding protein [Maridesulfovibrio zosterae]